eukprot:scaffold3155_cov18-Tisochrysis_lutea.AAC.1
MVWCATKEKQDKDTLQQPRGCDSKRHTGREHSVVCGGVRNKKGKQYRKRGAEDILLQQYLEGLEQQAAHRPHRS